MKYEPFALVGPYLILCACGNRDVPPSIVIQPFNTISPVYTRIIKDSLSRYFIAITIAPAQDLPSAAWYAPRERYRADKVLDHMKPAAGNNAYMIGLTTKDISTIKHEKDWGVMGLATLNGHTALASTFRLDKRNAPEQLFKVVIHELGHTFGLTHCEKKICFMRDAEGGRPLNEEKRFCDDCHRYLRSRHVLK